MEIDVGAHIGANIGGGDDLYPIMREILKRDIELLGPEAMFWVVGLRQDLRLVFIDMLAIGEHAFPKMEPMDVFSRAVERKTPYIVFAQSTTGELKFEATEMKLLQTMINAGDVLRIHIKDYIVLNERAYMSFKDFEV